MPEPWLVELEQALADDREGEILATAVVVLAAVAGRAIELDLDELHGASRRAMLLLAAGGDPERGLDLRGRAVGALAADLDEPERRTALARGLTALRARVAGLPHVSEALHALADDPETAWLAFACALLAEELSAEDE